MAVPAAFFVLVQALPNAETQSPQRIAEKSEKITTKTRRHKGPQRTAKNGRDSRIPWMKRKDLHLFVIPS
jgi:hypothetical protein